MPLKEDKKAQAVVGGSGGGSLAYAPSYPLPSSIPTVAQPSPEPAPVAPPVAPPAARREVAAQPRPVSRATSAKKLYVFSLLLLAGYCIWAVDGYFTVIGAISTLLPATPMGVVIAIAIHFGLSWGQHELISEADRKIQLIGIALLAANVASNIYGISVTGKQFLPTFFADLPDNWLGLWFQSLLKPQTAELLPAWAPQALLIIVLSITLAWYAEKIRDYFQQQWVTKWEQRAQR